MRGQVTKSVAAAAVVGLSAACLFPSLDLGPSDASSDAGSDADVAILETGVDAGGWCATLSPKPIFCADFDEGSALAGWDDANLDQGTLTLGTIYESSPAALVAQVPATQSGYPVAALEKTFAQPTGDVVVAFDLDLDTIDPAAQYTKVLSLTFDGADPPFAFFLQLPDGSHADVVLAIPDGSGGVKYDDYEPTAIPAVGQWTHVEVDLTKSTTDATMTSGQVLFDGTVVIPAIAFGSSAAFGNVTLAVGFVGTNAPTNPWTVRVDDVTYDVK